MHRLFIGHFLAHKRLVVHTDDLVASYDPCLFCRSAGDDVLHTHGVVAYHELYTYAGERAAQVVSGRLHVFGADVDRVGVKFGEDLWQGLLHKVVHVYTVHILVVNDAQQIIETVAASVDDIETVAGEMVGVETAQQDAQHDTDGEHQWHKTTRLIQIHVRMY